MDENDLASQHLQRCHKVREVEQYQGLLGWKASGARTASSPCSRSSTRRGGVRPGANRGRISVIIKLLGMSKHTTFDLGRKVLMFSNLGT